MMKTLISDKSILSYFDWKFFLRFMVLLLFFYFLTQFLMLVAKPGSPFYSQYLFDNFHFVSWMRSSILYTSNVFTQWMGLDTYIASDKIIAVKGGRSLIMARQCLGLEITGFWVAFILAHKIDLKRKILWAVAGVLAIWFLNTWRVAILLYALQNKWPMPTKIDHHDLFNYITYALIAGLIYLFYRKGSNENLPPAVAGT